MKKTFIISSCSILISLAGCSGSASNIQTRAYNDDPRSLSIVSENESKGYARTNNDIEQHEEINNTAKRRAKSIAVNLSQMDGVDKANVVVTGNTAIVGISLVNELNDDELIALKHRIENEVKELDSGIDHVAVTSAPDLVERILHAEDNNPPDSAENDATFRLVPTL